MISSKTCLIPKSLTSKTATPKPLPAKSIAVESRLWAITATCATMKAADIGTCSTIAVETGIAAFAGL